MVGELKVSGDIYAVDVYGLQWALNTGTPGLQARSSNWAKNTLN